MGTSLASRIAYFASFSDYSLQEFPHIEKEFEMTKLLEKRFSELAEQLEGIAAAKRSAPHPVTEKAVMYVDNDDLLNWKVKAKTLLINTCGESSQQMASFITAERSLGRRC
ncbi:hypothetical protein ALO41_102809, partial [Pseudomonas amygdali pv. ulmi]